jgi:ureidoacrylate peracid hydrolase
MLSDATATWTDEEHAVTLNNFSLFFGEVMTTDDAIGKLGSTRHRKKV